MPNIPYRGRSRAGGVGTGIARGARDATSTILNVLLKKKQLSQAEEYNKATSKFLKAKTDLARISLQGEAQKAKSQQKMMGMIEGGALDREDMGWSMGPGGMTISGGKGQLTELQKQQQEVTEKELATQKAGALGIINQLKERVMSGTLQTKKGASVTYTPGMAAQYLAQEFPKIDIGDPEIQEALFGLEGKSPEFKPTGKVSVKAALGAGRAYLSPKTKEKIMTIKSQADIDELKRNRLMHEEQDIDVDAILEYFGQRK